MKVKVIGAGSIGNHLSHASRSLGWSVDLVDSDPIALERTKNQIYRSRYGNWDDAIRLFRSEGAPQGDHDLIMIGTPPDTHMVLALQAVEEKPKAVLVEKPVCTPDLQGADVLLERAQAFGCQLFVGYDHVVGSAANRFCELIDQGVVGDPQTLDVEFREHWGGIFAAHPWLSGPADSYLGFWRRGGGSTGEHSHAFNLWQHFANRLGWGRVKHVTANLDYVQEDGVDYDRLCLANLITDRGFMGRVVQDVVTRPVRKWARLQGSKGFIEWICAYRPGVDAVVTPNGQGELTVETFAKTRPQDFILELKHLAAALDGDASKSPLSIERGLDTMMVVAAAHRSSQERQSVTIDWSRGYSTRALNGAA
jgi:predicted dehydrogenase